MSMAIAAGMDYDIEVSDSNCPKCGHEAYERQCECDDGLSYHDCGDDSCCCVDDSPNACDAICATVGAITAGVAAVLGTCSKSGISTAMMNRTPEELAEDNRTGAGRGDNDREPEGLFSSST